MRRGNASQLCAGMTEPAVFLQAFFDTEATENGMEATERHRCNQSGIGFTEGNEENEEPGQELRLFVSFVTFCESSERIGALD